MTMRLSLAFLSIVAACLAWPSGGLRADWVDNFDGGIHNPAGGLWDFTGFTLAASPVEISNYTPSITNNQIRIPSPLTGAPAVSLMAGWVASQTGTTHHYQDVRLAGTIGVGNNNGGGNNNEVGLLTRLNDFDTYVMLVDHSDGRVKLLKSLNATPTTPVLMASQAITNYAPLSDFYFVFDVLDTPQGTRLTGRVYDDRTRATLLNTIVAVDDLGGIVPGGPLPSFYTGFVAQYNADAASPTFVDAFFDDMSATTLRPGDVDLNGVVDRRDVARLSHGYGNSSDDVTWDDGDVNGDGIVSLADLMVVQRSMSAATPPIIITPPVAAAIPEPSTLTLGVTAMIALATIRGRRGRRAA